MRVYAMKCKCVNEDDESATVFDIKVVDELTLEIKIRPFHPAAWAEISAKVHESMLMLGMGPALGAKQ